MANKKSYKKKVEDIAVTEPIIEAEEAVVTTEVEVEPTVEKEELKVAEYEVILATPTYFIINKNGNNVTIKKNNNYGKGDMATL